MLLCLVLIDGPREMSSPLRMGFKVFVLFLFSELAVRTVIKYIVPLAAPFYPQLVRYSQKIINASESRGMHPALIESHPFLQFTLPRSKIEKVPDYYYGFKNIKLSDVPKPPGVIRIACLGGSTTMDGYPEMMREFLARTCPQKSFQVLNFGVGWWSSVHSTVNFILNVVDFAPDYVIFHNNANDDQYRGYDGIRGDGSHAYTNIEWPGEPDEIVCRTFVLCRLLKLFLLKKFPKKLMRNQFVYLGRQTSLREGKKYIYDPKELYIYDRNIDTILSVAKTHAMKLLLMTMPYSATLPYGHAGDQEFSGREHDRVFRSHMRQLNEILREKAGSHNLILVDAEAVIRDKDGLFVDTIHLTPKGNMTKALLAGQAIVDDLQCPCSMCFEWREIAEEIGAKT